MSLNWDWKQKLGYMKFNVVKDNKIYHVKLDIYKANCLGCYIQKLKDGTYTVGGFWNDEKHLKNCLGLSKGSYYGDNMYSKRCNASQYLTEIGLNTYYENAMKIAKLFVKTKEVKVVLYYKKIK